MGRSLGARAGAGAGVGAANAAVGAGAADEDAADEDPEMGCEWEQMDRQSRQGTAYVRYGDLWYVYGVRTVRVAVGVPVNIGIYPL